MNGAAIAPAVSTAMMLRCAYVLEQGTPWPGLYRAAGGLFTLLSVTALLLLAPGPAQARDPDGRYAQSPLKQWFDGLRSGRGPCCSDADGSAVLDADWETHGGRYRVRLDGQWLDVPEDALVTVPNKFGRAVVWPVKGFDGATRIRCFIPGAGT